MNREVDTKTIIYVIIGFLLFRGMMMAGGWSRAELLSKLLVLPGLVLGLTIHEYSHAKASDKLGDPTPERQGRLTLNPFAHLDPIGTLCLFFAGFGWGKPVVIDPTYYRNPAKDSAKVAFAGPLSNFILSFIMFLTAAIVYSAIPSNMITIILYNVLYWGAYINLALGIFNLLPFPPLDGSKIFGYFLKGKAKAFLWTLERYSTIILMILFVTGLPSLIISPIVAFVANGMNLLIEKFFMAIW